MSTRKSQLAIPGVTNVKHGKVRTIYELPDGNLLFVATDRVSAFDVVLPTNIPDKGAVLTQVSNYWFETLKSVPEHHILIKDTARYPDYLKPFQKELEGRSVIVRKTKVVPFECVVRGYISGSLWKAYKNGESPYGLNLPEGLKESSPFPTPIFTPTTKADEGHDMPVSFEEMSDAIGQDLANQLRDISLAVFNEGSEIARTKGIILADTKFEFGMIDGKIILIDECLTPDSSRFWPEDRYEEGKSQPSYDKQFVRDYLSTLDWDKTYPGPELPDEVVNATRMKYLEVYRLLTGNELEK